jgi:GMP synthase-like glutamine amidotransferase
MKPVAIFRHAKTEGPGYFATFLDLRSIPWQLIAIDRGNAVPTRAEAYSGLCLMGGPMSVNDPLPWIADECALIRDAVATGVPVIGHCLGGQLISRALGGEVRANAGKEIGWGKARAENGASGDADPQIARRWLGDWLEQTAGIADVFQWHGETFSLPTGAQRLFGNDFCANQAFVLGPHLALQCHVEMTPEMIGAWCAGWASEVQGLAALPACVQTPEQMLAETARRLPVMRRLADQLYSVWTGGLKT